MNLWPLAVYVAIVGMLVVTMLSLSFVLGQRHQDRATGSPYSSSYSILKRCSYLPGRSRSVKPDGLATPRYCYSSRYCSRRLPICGASALLIGDKEADGR